MERNSSSSFMKECLSKSIQWNSPQLLSSMDSDKLIIKLENLLNVQWNKSFGSYGDLDAQEKLEIFLLEIKSKEFNIMKGCIDEIQPYSPHAVEAVWTLYNQYLNTDFDKILCVYCKIRCRVDIKHCSRYLYRQNIISANLHKKIILRKSKAGSQEDLWNDLEEECTKYYNAKHVLDAIYSGLVAEGESYKQLISELEKCREKVNPTFACTCQESCSEVFTPNKVLEWDEKGPKTKHQSKAVKALSHECPCTFNKENHVPKSEYATSEYGHFQAKKKTISKCPDISQKVHTEGNEQNDPNLQSKTDDNAFTSVEADSQHAFSKSKSKRKKGCSTNIYNFYNKGPVSLGTNVVDMKPGIHYSTQNYSENGMNNDNLIQRKTRLSLPAPTDKDETFAKRLKYNQSPPGFTNPARLETSDSPTDHSSEDDSENNCLSAGLMEIGNNYKECHFSSMKNNGANNISHAKSNNNESSHSQRFISDVKSATISDVKSASKDTKTLRSRSFRRQKSAPSGY